VFWRVHKLPELDPVFVMQGDERNNQIGAGFAALAALTVAIAARGIVERKAAIDGVGRIDDESRTSASAPSSPATAPASRRGRRLTGWRWCSLLGLDYGDQGEKGKCARKDYWFVSMHWG
jgi:hypothetical protein